MEGDAVDMISQREMRNNSSEILRRVAQGESFLVTNHGHPAALLSPPPRTRHDELVASGQLHEATETDWSTLPPAVRSEVDLDVVLADTRRDR